MAAGLVRIEDGERARHAEFRFGQMVVGDDEVEAEFGGGIGGGKGANAGVDADDETNAFAGGGFENLALHAVAFAQAMRDVEADASRRAFSMAVFSSTVAVVPSTS